MVASQMGSRSRILALAKSVKERMTTFHGGSDPWLARSWLENVIEVFTYITCTEAEQVELAVFHLRDQAATWWKTQRTVLGDQSLSWSSFREVFEAEYFSETFCVDQCQKFLQLKQGDRSVNEYHTEFTKLSEFCPQMVARDRDRMQHFIRGLAAYIRLKMSCCIVTTYREALDRAQHIESTQRQVTQERDAEKSKGQSSRSSGQKRPAQSSDTRDSSGRQKGKRPAGPSSGSQRKEISERKCFRCGSDSHRVSDCPSDQSVCYYCKQPGHMIGDCPRRAQLERTDTSASGGQSTQPGHRRVPSIFRAPQQQRSLPTTGRMYQIQGREYMLLPVDSQSEICYEATPVQQQPPAAQTYSVPPYYVQQPPSVPQSPIPTEWRPPISQPAAQPSSTEVGRAYAITRDEAQRADGSVFREPWEGVKPLKINRELRLDWDRSRAALVDLR
ncbi:uncharacterized protein LOC141819501, partial [Curcuma longa]|uniref:uncharacterized protein LOC141819501 n=1 Tax=Curcuma longa TaxID=136217 RepID=UPI003D9DFDB0